MGPAPSQEEKAAKLKDSDVNNFLKKKQKGDPVVTLLLLGSGESGKTTIFKQMTLIHGNGFAPDYVQSVKAKLCGNIIDGTYHIIRSIQQNNSYDSYSDQVKNAFAFVLQQRMDYFTEVTEDVKEDKIEEVSPRRFSPSDYISKDLAIALSTLWENKEFQVAYRRSARQGKTDVSDSYPELMKRVSENYPKWGGPDWAPSTEDILLVRVRTTGMAEQTFSIEKRTYKLIDVGGQKAERKKWVHLFAGVTGVIYVVSLSEYDQTLFEDNQTNRLQDSLGVFSQTVSHPAFASSAIVLFLNKIDLFFNKYVDQKVPINISGLFPTAPRIEDEEDENTCANAIGWFTEQYVSRLSLLQQGHVFVHTTCALDRNQMEVVINACTTHILKENMKLAGLLPFEA